MKSSDLSTSHLIVMLGIPGSGKSYFANSFAKTFLSPLISFDNIFNKLDEATADKNTLKNIINQIAIDLIPEIAKTKKTIIVDGWINNRSDYETILKIAKNIGYEPLFIWTQTDIDTAKKRCSKQRSINASSIEKFDAIVRDFNKINKMKKNLVVVSGKHTYSSQLRIVLNYLSHPTR